MSLVTYSLEGKTAVVTMDDGKANALSDAMIAELTLALDRAEAEAQAIVLTGRPERFSAGFDLKTMMQSPESARALLTKGAALLMRLFGTPLPLVIASTGHAVAGGALVLLTGDVRLGTPGAFRIGLNEVSIGLPVPVLAMELARSRIAAPDLVKATLRATIFGPEEAARVGFLDAVVPAEELEARAKAEAATLGGLSRMAYAATKRRLRGATIDHITSTLEADMAAIATGS